MCQWACTYPTCSPVASRDTCFFQRELTQSYLNMAQQSVSLRWNDHPNEFAMLCKNFLDHNYLVDCLLSAEGQYVEAHRLVLSASSAYFRMLFNEEREKHPLVILVGVSFETLQAVIDFVYSGETQIPEGNLEAFLALAHTLQIRGLNALTRNNGNKGLCGRADENISACPSENQDNCVRQDSSSNLEDSPEDSLEPLLYHSGGLSDAQTSSHVSFGESRDPWESVHSRPVGTSPQEQQVLSECSMLARGSGITVKQEPLSTEFLEPNQNILDDVKCEPMPENLQSEMDAETVLTYSQQNLSQYSNCEETACGRVGPASAMVLTHLQERHHQHHHYQQISQLPDEVPACPDLLERPQSRLPVISGPKCDHLDEMESKEPTVTHDVHEMDEEMVEESALGEQNINESSRTVRPPAARGRGRQPGKQEWRRQCRTTNKCSYCHKTFSKPSLLQMHVRRHTGEQLFKCSECDASFTHSSSLNKHRRIHTGERPSICDVCGRTFADLLTHKRTHTGERPFKCNECDASFTSSTGLNTHRRVHTGERPFKCSECDACFTTSSYLKTHSRYHTGERPFKCSECEASFAESSNLKRHRRTHTGDQRLKCS